MTSHVMPPEAAYTAGDSALYGLLAQFDSADKLVEATRRVHAAGYRRIDAFAPYPVEGASDAMDFHKTRVPLLVLIGGIIGGASGFALQYWLTVHHYPLNVGGRPLNSWPMYIPITFELAILVAVLFAVLGMLALNGLPEPYHPLFNVPQFSLTHNERFFLCIETRDPEFDYTATRDLLESMNADEVYDVPV